MVEPVETRRSPNIWDNPAVYELENSAVDRGGLIESTLRSIDERQREAAALLGASPGRVRREIDLPAVSRGLAVAAGFAFAISLGEFGATVFLARPDHPTLPVAIFRFLGRPGALNAAEAYALAVVLLAVTVVSVLLVERLRPTRDGWF